jgi:hypothetical protein
MMTEKPTPLQVNVMGYDGKPLTAFYLVYKSAQTLVAAKSQAFIEARNSPDITLVTNNAAATDFDLKINDDAEFYEAIQAYRRMQSRIVISDDNQALKPKFQVDDYTEKGVKLEMGRTLSNGHMATVFAAFFLDAYVGRQLAMDRFLILNDDPIVQFEANQSNRFDIVTI